MISSLFSATAAADPDISYQTRSTATLERDDMVTKGYLQSGVRFTIKRYDAHLMPATMRKNVATKAP